MNEQEQKSSNEEESSHINQYLIPARKKLFRSPSNYILLGISGGLADYLNVNPIFIRVLFIITAVLGGWGIIAYVICAFLIPEHPSLKDKGKFGRLSSTKLLGFSMIGVGIYYWLPTFGIFRIFSLFSYLDNLLLGLSLVVFGFFILLKLKNNYETKSEPAKFYRAKRQRRLLGICEGLSNYLDVDVNLIRMICVLLTFMTLGLTAVFYIVIGYFIPNQEVAVSNE